MTPAGKAFRLRSAVLPLGVFLGVIIVHYLWSGFFPEYDPVQARWASLPAKDLSWLKRYIETQGYYLGYAYALSLTFAAVALRRYREDRFCQGRIIAIGGVTFSGFLAVAGCFLVGCCGSPMLVVYLSLFGASFLPLAKPLLAALTTISILGAWWWMNRHQPSSSDPAPTKPSCHGDGCRCD